MKVLLVSGEASEVQGWGDFATTERIRRALEVAGLSVEVLHVFSMEDLQQGLDMFRPDLVWSSIYQISGNTQFIGLDSETPWVMDLLEERGLPYVGSSAAVVKVMLDKSETLTTLARSGVPVPRQYSVEPGEELPRIDFPAFVKPRYESQSAGVSEESIVESPQALRERVRYVHEAFRQCALVEEFLPGAELTVAMLGESVERGARYQGAVNILDPSAYERYPVIMTDISTALTLELLPGSRAEEAEALAAAAVSALGCRDHVRVDMREDRSGNLKVIEVNGIPGLTPGISRSCLIHRLYNPGLSEAECYGSLIRAIIDSAGLRVRRAQEDHAAAERRSQVLVPA